MNRRTYLGALAAAGVGVTVGCLDSSTDGDPGGNETTAMPASDDAVLGPPTDFQGDPSAAAWPTYGDPLPVFEATDPFTDRTVSTTDFEDERAVLLTFFYTHCPDGVCPALVQRLRQSQQYARENGFATEVAFLAVTFDPERDTAATLSAYADEQGVDHEAGNWHFLRPESYQAAKRIVDDKYGMPLEKRDPEGGDHDHDDEGGDHDHDPEGGAADYVFPHFELLVLANRRGYVERGYSQLSRAPATRIQDDLQTVLEG
jgi:protein SCO1/2